MMSVNILLSKAVYSHKAILKTAYLLQEKYLINISENTHNYVLEISDIKNEPFVEEEFIKLINEQQIREELNEQFGKLRECIYNRAFYNFRDDEKK